MTSDQKKRKTKTPLPLIHFSKVMNPDEWSVGLGFLEFKTPSDAKKAEALFNDLVATENALTDRLSKIRELADRIENELWLKEIRKLARQIKRLCGGKK